MDFKKEFQKRIASEFDLTRSFHLNVKENQHPTKCSHLVERQKDFSDQKRIHTRKNFVASKLKANFFVLLRVALLVLHA